MEGDCDFPPLSMITRDVREPERRPKKPSGF